MDYRLWSLAILLLHIASSHTHHSNYHFSHIPSHGLYINHDLPPLYKGLHPYPVILHFELQHFQPMIDISRNSMNCYNDNSTLYNKQEVCLVQDFLYRSVFAERQREMIIFDKTLHLANSIIQSERLANASSYAQDIQDQALRIKVGASTRAEYVLKDFNDVSAMNTMTKRNAWGSVLNFFGIASESEMDRMREKLSVRNTDLAAIANIEKAHEQALHRIVTQSKQFSKHVLSTVAIEAREVEQLRQGTIRAIDLIQEHFQTIVEAQNQIEKESLRFHVNNMILSNILTSLNQRKLNPALLSASDLTHIFGYTQEHLNKTDKNLKVFDPRNYNLYNFLEARAYNLTGTSLEIIVEIPTYYQLTTYKVLKLSPVPIPIGENLYALLKTPTNYVLEDTQSVEQISVPPHVVQHCREHTYCSFAAITYPTFDKCVTNLVKGKLNETNKFCSYQVFHRTRAIISEISHAHYHIAGASSLRMECTNNNSLTHTGNFPLSPMAHINIPCHCHVIVDQEEILYYRIQYCVMQGELLRFNVNVSSISPALNFSKISDFGKLLNAIKPDPKLAKSLATELGALKRDALDMADFEKSLPYFGKILDEIATRNSPSFDYQHFLLNYSVYDAALIIFLILLTLAIIRLHCQVKRIIQILGIIAAAGHAPLPVSAASAYLFNYDNYTYNNLKLPFKTEASAAYPRIPLSPPIGLHRAGVVPSLPQQPPTPSSSVPNKPSHNDESPPTSPSFLLPNKAMTLQPLSVTMAKTHDHCQMSMHLHVFTLLTCLLMTTASFVYCFTSRKGIRVIALIQNDKSMTKLPLVQITRPPGRDITQLLLRISTLHLKPNQFKMVTEFSCQKWFSTTLRLKWCKLCGLHLYEQSSGQKPLTNLPAFVKISSLQANKITKIINSPLCEITINLEIDGMVYYPIITAPLQVCQMKNVTPRVARIQAAQ